MIWGFGIFPQRLNSSALKNVAGTLSTGGDGYILSSGREVKTEILAKFEMRFSWGVLIFGEGRDRATCSLAAARSMDAGPRRKLAARFAVRPGIVAI
jgi:hypothetical protein